MASMGQAEAHAEDRMGAITFRLRRVSINTGGYDADGAYWGVGPPLYCAESVDEVPMAYTAWAEHPDGTGHVVFYLRASSRVGAKRAVLASYPNARFDR